MLVDVHAHLDHPKFKDDIERVIENAKNADVTNIITNGINPESNRAVLKLAEKYDNVKAALGIYPVDSLVNVAKVKNYPMPPPFDMDEEIDFIKKNKDKIIAIGEAGLDYHWSTEHNDVQKEVFQKLIGLSKKIKKPLILHSRKAEEDVIEMLEQSDAKKVNMHCFGGNLKLAKRVEENKWFLSIPANIVFSTHFQEIVRQTNINRLLTETDCPFLGPVKGERNEPANVAYTIKKIAEIKGFEEEEVKKNIFMNFKELFS